jgi:DsbC/DsbD-like thiol-disulfide interchange protein
MRKVLFLVARLWLVCALVASASISWAQTSPGGTSDVVKVAASLSGAAKAGGTAELVVELKIKEPFHVNANPASEEYLIPTQVLVAKAPGVQPGKPVYPAAEQKKFAFYDKLLKVYEATVQVRVPISFTSEYKGASVTGELTYQACNDRSCLPPVTLKWKAGAAGASALPGASLSGGAEQDSWSCAIGSA